MWYEIGFLQFLLGFIMAKGNTFLSNGWLTVVQLRRYGLQTAFTGYFLE